MHGAWLMSSRMALFKRVLLGVLYFVFQCISRAFWRISYFRKLRISDFSTFQVFLEMDTSNKYTNKRLLIDTVIDRVTQIVRLPKQLLVFQYPMCVISVFQQFWNVFRISISPQCFLYVLGVWNLLARPRLISLYVFLGNSEQARIYPLRCRYKIMKLLCRVGEKNSPASSRWWGVSTAPILKLIAGVYSPCMEWSYPWWILAICICKYLSFGHRDMLQKEPGGSYCWSPGVKAGH